MAKPNYSFAKRQRDLAKKKKKEEKRQRKLDAKAAQNGEVAGDGAEGADAAEVESTEAGSAEPAAAGTGEDQPAS
jgi:hypothetical protein